MDHRALDHPLEPCRRLGVLAALRDEVGQFGIDVFDEVAAQGVEIDVARAHHGRRVLIVDQREADVRAWRIRAGARPPGQGAR